MARVRRALVRLSAVALVSLNLLFAAASPALADPNSPPPPDPGATTSASSSSASVTEFDDVAPVIDVPAQDLTVTITDQAAWDETQTQQVLVTPAHYETQTTWVSSGYWTQPQWISSGYWTQEWNPGYWQLVTVPATWNWVSGYWEYNPGYWEYNPGYWEYNPGYWEYDCDDTGCYWSYSPGYWDYVPGYWDYVPGYWDYVPGYWEYEPSYSYWEYEPGYYSSVYIDTSHWSDPQWVDTSHWQSTQVFVPDQYQTVTTVVHHPAVTHTEVVHEQAVTHLATQPIVTTPPTPPAQAPSSCDNVFCGVQNWWSSQSDQTRGLIKGLAVGAAVVAVAALVVATAPVSIPALIAAGAATGAIAGAGAYGYLAGDAEFDPTTAAAWSVAAGTVAAAVGAVAEALLPAITAGGGASQTQTAKDIVQQAAQSEAAKGLPYLRQFMSPAQQIAYDANPAAGSRFVGSAVHNAVFRNVLRPLGWSYNASNGPDFTAPTGETVELTTVNQLASHVAKGLSDPRYLTAEYATYTLP